MDCEINLDSIRALEKQIQEHEKAIIQLKRTRNSLLNVSTRLPPEILGKIFRWNVIPDGDWGGLPKASYNFLLVCHHWFQVALGTPDLWSFWGNSIEDWARRHARCRTAPFDLVLTRCASNYLDDTTRSALQDCAARDTIRRLHLKGVSAELLNSIISSIITKGEETRLNRMESFISQSTGRSRVDVSDFFSRYHFPKLRHLDLSGFGISSWDLLNSRTTSLTSLSLTVIKQSPLPTLSQMLSILAANPNLQYLKLSHGSVPDVDSDRSSSQTRLRHLKTLRLRGDLRRVFGLLNRLELPDRLDDLDLYLSGYSPSDLPRTLGPYLRNHMRRRLPDRLKLSATDSFAGFTIVMGDTTGSDLTREGWFVAVGWAVSANLGEEDADKLCFDTIAHFSSEVHEVTTTLPILRSEELCIQMCNLTHLHLKGIDVSTWFVMPKIREPHGFKDILRGLRSISISEPSLSGGDWSPLTNFLARRAAVGNRISSLKLNYYPRMSEGVVESIRRVVEVFEERGSNDIFYK